MGSARAAARLTLYQCLHPRSPLRRRYSLAVGIPRSVYHIGNSGSSQKDGQKQRVQAPLCMNCGPSDSDTSCCSCRNCSNEHRGEHRVPGIALTFENKIGTLMCSGGSHCTLYLSRQRCRIDVQVLLHCRLLCGRLTEHRQVTIADGLRSILQNVIRGWDSGHEFATSKGQVRKAESDPGRRPWIPPPAHDV